VGDEHVMQIPLLVAALGRSGTTSAARYYGLGHESRINKNGISTYRAWHDGGWHISLPQSGEVKRLKPANVIHQVRHPLGAIASHVTCHPMTFRFLASKVKIPQGDKLLMSLHAWVEWNRMLEPHAGATVMLESVAGMPVLNERSHPPVSWQDLKSCDERKAAQAVQLARRYGYAV
jgi:hypothetical protein